jgi:iron complex transport system permease protein
MMQRLHNRMRHRSRWIMVFLICLLAVALAGALSVGSVAIPFSMVAEMLWHWLGGTSLEQFPASAVDILFTIRLPRVLLVALTGAALSASGAAYQGLFRNSLADPYVIGVASGAGLGAMVAVLAGPVSWFGTIAMPVGAFSGAIIVVLAVTVAAQRRRERATQDMILAGVAIGTLASALTTFLMIRAGRQAGQLLAFLLGSASSVGWEAVRIVTVCIVIGLTCLVIAARDLNVLLLSEEQADLLGIDVRRVRVLVIFGATLMTAAAVAFHGLIGFVGIIVPHALRLLFGGDNRTLVPFAAIFGALFLLSADVLARTLQAPVEIPLGIVTACIGSPVFLALLLRRNRGL